MAGECLPTRDLTSESKLVGGGFNYVAIVCEYRFTGDICALSLRATTLFHFLCFGSWVLKKRMELTLGFR